jgi:hypothetical protein
MKVTTSREPSAKARRLGKALASFLCVPYMNRGKQSLDEAETWLVVVEDHGNPQALAKRSSGKEERLEFTLSQEPVAGRLKRRVPVVIGGLGDAHARKIAAFFELDWQERTETLPGRMVVAAPGQIDFIDDGVARFRLKI